MSQVNYQDYQSQVSQSSQAEKTGRKTREKDGWLEESIKVDEYGGRG